MSVGTGPPHHVEVQSLRGKMLVVGARNPGLDLSFTKSFLNAVVQSARIAHLLVIGFCRRIIEVLSEIHKARMYVFLMHAFFRFVAHVLKGGMRGFHGSV